MASCSTGGGSRRVSVAAQRRLRTGSFSKPVHCIRANDGDLHPADAYAAGVLQGLQRLIRAYGARVGVCLPLQIDGILSQDTVDGLMGIVSQIGLPPQVQGIAPQSDNDICDHARAYAEWIASSLRVKSDFIPRPRAELPRPCPEGALTSFSDAASGAAKPAITGRRIIIGGAALAGLALLR